MAKLNAKISSERASRTVSKSGDEFLRIQLYNGNNHVATLEYNSTSPNTCALITHKWSEQLEIIEITEPTVKT